MENAYKEAIARYEEAQEKLSYCRFALRGIEDGFRYVTQLCCYGSVYYESHTNPFFVQELCDEYTGDNGIVNIYTTNPNHGINTYGDVKVLTEEQILAMSKENVSMSRAITNWIARTM